MKIVSWNINGIRSLKKDIRAIIDDLDADIACFQETKITKELMTEKFALVDGYRSHFSYSKTKAGYSGVVTYCRKGIQPMHATDSLVSRLGSEVNELKFSLSEDILKSLDSEGRTLITQHQLKEPVCGKSMLTILNLYCPCVTGETEGRELFRLQFLQVLEERIKQLRIVSHVVVLGDINISHKVIDNCEPGDEMEYLNQPHRQWLDRLLSNREEGLLIDTYRTLNPDQKYAYTCWNTRTNCRQTNYGTRIDYILLDKNLGWCLNSAEVLAKYLGSDHCPVKATLNSVCIQASATAPYLCSSHKYKAKQQKLTMFMSKPTSKRNPLDVFDSFAPAVNVVNKKPTDTNSGNADAAKKEPDNAVAAKRTKKRCLPDSKTTNSLNNFLTKRPKVEAGPCDSGVQISSSLEHSLSQASSDGKESTLSQQSNESESSALSQPLHTSTAKRVAMQRSSATAWSTIFNKKAQLAPVCAGHNENCILQTVKKSGENKGRQFYSCARPPGISNDKQSRCSFFKWADN